MTQSSDRDAARSDEHRYRVLFENSPLSLWEEDWSEVKRFLDGLKASGVVDFAAWFDRRPEAVRECARRIRVLDVNQVTLQLVGARDKAELLENFERLLTPGTLEMLRRELIALAEGRPQYRADAPLRTLQGETIEVAVNASVPPGHEESMDLVLISMLDITQRNRAEAELRREHEALRQMIDAQERERRLIGYEIHDGLAQHLAGAMLLFQAAQRQRGPSPPDSADNLEAGMQLLGEAMAESRRLINDLRPAALEEAGLMAAVSDLVRQLQGRWEMDVELVAEVQFQRLPPAFECSVFRIVQEALSNVHKHSGSRTARVELRQTGDRLRVEIRDWGEGFDPTQTPAGHFGLESIRERARLLRGSARIESAPGQGTRIAVGLPLPQTEGGRFSGGEAVQAPDT